MGFLKSPAGLLNACFGFFPATSSVLGTHKVTSTGKRQGHFFDWQLQCLRGINCIRVFAWRTKHLPQILPDVCIAIRSSVSCRARQDLTSYQGGRGEESKWRTHLWYPPQSTCTKPPSPQEPVSSDGPDPWWMKEELCYLDPWQSNSERSQWATRLSREKQEEFAFVAWLISISKAMRQAKLNLG